MGFKLKRTMDTKKGVTKNQVRQMIIGRLEDKVFSQALTGTFSLAGVTNYVSAIAQGDGLGDRAGNVIRPKSLEFRVTIIDTVSSFSRVIFFQDNENVGTAPTVANVLQTALPNSTLLAESLSLRRFKILYDIMCPLSSAGDLTRFYHRVLPVKGAIHFSGTGATSASGGKNAIYVLLISTTNTATLDARTLIHYTDA